MNVTVAFTVSLDDLLGNPRLGELLRGLEQFGEIEKTSQNDSSDTQKTWQSAVVPSEMAPTAQPVCTVSHAQMKHAVQEYCVRMNAKLRAAESSIPIKKLAETFLLELTENTASKTADVVEQYREKVFDSAVNDYIPTEFQGKF